MDKDIEKRFNKLDETIEELCKRLFKGNGSLPWDVRLDRLEQFKKFCYWFLGSTIVMMLVVIGKLVYDAFAK